MLCYHQILYVVFCIVIFGSYSWKNLNHAIIPHATDCISAATQLNDEWSKGFLIFLASIPIVAEQCAEQVISHCLAILSSSSADYEDDDMCFSDMMKCIGAYGKHSLWNTTLRNAATHVVQAI